MEVNTKGQYFEMRLQFVHDTIAKSVDELFWVYLRYKVRIVFLNFMLNPLRINLQKNEKLER